VDVRSSVLYPIGRSARIGSLLALNPMTHLITVFARSSRAAGPGCRLAVTLIVAIGMFGAAWLLFHAAEFDSRRNL